MPSAPSLLPPNATKAERALEAATARLADMPVPVRELWNPDACPLELLPWLAWAYSVDQWESSWTETQKRAVVRNALFVHRYKGTLGAMERALASLGYGMTIREWFDESPRGEPFTFRVDINITGIGIDEPLYAQLERLINDAKNVRSHLRSLRLVGRIDGCAFVAGAVTSGDITHVGPWIPPVATSQIDLTLHTATLQSVNLTTGPSNG